MPEELRRRIISEIYRRADALDWDSLSQSDRSLWYSRWLSDPDVGGILDQFMTRDQVRLWIKDVPMKHYTRARGGLGAYADLAANRLPDVATLVKLAFGDTWSLIDDSLREKPNRCEVARGDRRILMIWGPPRSFQSLVWAGLNAVLDKVPESVILVVSRQGERLSEGQLDRQRRIGDLIGVEIRHLTVSIAVKSSVREVSHGS